MAPPSLNSFLGNARVVEILRRAIAQDRLPHAMIFCGPPGVGKCTLAVLLAQYLNCPSPKGESGCGTCSVCRRIAAVNDTRHLSCLSLKSGGFCGSCANCRARSLRHPDVRVVEPEKTTITIGQVRSLISEIAYQPFEARYRTVILDPADQMKQEAHNSLLKTLEEPPSRTLIILVTSKPYLLLETIRSRSRLLQFGGIPPHQIERYLQEVEGRSPEESRLAAGFSGGSLGSALEFDTGEFRELRSLALQFVTLLLRKRSFAEVSALAAGIAKEKELFPLWLDSAAAILQDLFFCHVALERVKQADLLDELTALAGSSSHEVVVSALHWLKELRVAILRNLNRQLALEAMYLGITSGRKPPYALR